MSDTDLDDLKLPDFPSRYTAPCWVSRTLLRRQKGRGTTRAGKAAVPRLLSVAAAARSGMTRSAWAVPLPSRPSSPSAGARREQTSATLHGESPGHTSP